MEDLRRTFGDQLLCYMLACESSHLELPEASWTDSQTHVLEQLEVMSAMASAHEVSTGRLLVGQALLDRKEEFKTSLANSYRAHCGGEVDKVNPSEDRCLDLLSTIARDIYPAYLFPPREGGSRFDPVPTAAIFRHPLHVEFCQNALADEQFSGIFPDQEPTHLSEENLHEITSFIELSTGGGTTFQLALLADHIISAGRQRQLAKQAEGLHDFIDHVCNTLEDARLLASGKEIDVPAIVGLADVAMPEVDTITLGESKLQHLNETYAKLIPSGSTASIVLTTTIPLTIVSAIKWTSNSEPPERPNKDLLRKYEIWQKRVRDSVNIVRLSLLCASDIPTYLAARQESLTILDPTGMMPTLLDTSRKFGGSNIIRADQVESIASWFDTLSKGLGTLNISARKLLSAVSERLDPVDSLIDSVMTWENMFSGTPETGVRVCASLANLLEPSSVEERTKLFKEFKSIYDLRSRLVHGADTEPSWDLVIASRDKAISTALLALRKIFEIDKFHLKGSSERSNKLILWAI
jgi:hypothetical protein